LRTRPASTRWTSRCAAADKAALAVQLKYDILRLGLRTPDHSSRVVMLVPKNKASSIRCMSIDYFAVQTKKQLF